MYGVLILMGTACYGEVMGLILGHFNVNTGEESVLVLTLESSSIAARCDWSVWQRGTIGSDHYYYGAR